ncbi:MAG: hypothetical protein U0L65_08175 [Bacteroidales bacterium]|nr:hypothetical protein [Bacteroidales bacterium]
MKKWIVFVLGFVSGIVFLFLVLLIIGKTYATNDGMTYFEKPGKCISTKEFEVIQVIGDGYALAREIVDRTSLINIPSGLLVLVTNENGELYYDDQVIKVPEGKCMRQIGVYEYQTRMETTKTVPIVQVMNE